MANTASAQKRIRSNARKGKNNQVRKSRIRSAVRSARENMTDAAEAKKAVMAAVSELDRAAEKGVIHKNNAARRKSRLMKKLAALAKK